MTKSELTARLDQIFAPDIRVKLNPDSRIVGFELLSRAGTTFFLNSPNMILGQEYDTAFRNAHGITVEVAA